ncbi:hypothetical protein B296_00040940 [Ensete ventricosum]|uniref:Uncharacterized protein n=1 Tax=Ensete ventricosum TaxID=4639 RepID=A0A426XVG5_ENSVE|nr:hypothetical protein B296_00040940 [Ensete ventricosum]
MLEHFSEKKIEVLPPSSNLFDSVRRESQMLPSSSSSSNEQQCDLCMMDMIRLLLSLSLFVPPRRTNPLSILWAASAAESDCIHF